MNANRIPLLLATFLALTLSLALSSPSNAQVPKIALVSPDRVPEPNYSVLQKERDALVNKNNSLVQTGKDLQAKCTNYEVDSRIERECHADAPKYKNELALLTKEIEDFNVRVAAKGIAFSFAAMAATVEKEKKAARKERPGLSIIDGPLTPGSVAHFQHSGLELDVQGYEDRKSNVFSRLIELTKLRDECRAYSAACSKDGKAFDPREAMRRRDQQYYVWGEASYYIPISEFLKAPPAEMMHEIGALGGIALFVHLDEFYFLVKDITGYGSTSAGGQGAAKLGLKHAIKENLGVNP